MKSARRRVELPANLLPSFAAAAFGLALLAESLLIVSGQWLSPRRWVGLAAAALWLAAMAAHVAVVRRRGDDSDRPPAADGSGGGVTVAAVGEAGADGSAVDRSAVDRSVDGEASAGGRPLRIVFGALGLLGGAAAVALIAARGDDRPARDYASILGLWSAAVAVYALGVGLPGAWLRPDGLRAAARRHRRGLADAAGLLALALAVRLVALTAVPNVLTGDEGVFGLAARWMSQGEGGHMFGTYWANGTLSLVPQAALEWLLGPGRLATRLPTAIGGALAAPATYALGRVVATRRVGLVAGLLVAVSHLHVHVSRVGLGHGLDALWAALAGAALVAAVRRHDARAAAVAGVALGLAQYGYVGGRLVDVVALAFAVVSAVALAAAPDAAGRRRGARAWAAAVGVRPLAVAFGGALVTAGPMIRWALVRPEDYLSRLAAQGIVQTGKVAEVAERVGSAPLAIAWSQARDAWFAIAAAPAHEFYFSPYPMLDVVWTSLLGLGLAACVARPCDRGRLWLVLQIGLAWLTLALGAHASTASYRITGALPAMAVVAALALFALTDALSALGESTVADVGAAPAGVPTPSSPDGHRAAVAPPPAPRPSLADRATPAGLVVGIVAFQLWAYWGAFAPGCRFFDRGTAQASLLGEDVRAAGDGRAVFVLGRPWFDPGVYDSVRYLTDRRYELYDAVAPAGTRADADPALRTARIFDVPEAADLDALEARIRAAAPAMLVAVPERRSELDHLARRLGGTAVVERARCPSEEGPLLARTLVGDAPATGAP